MIAAVLESITGYITVIVIWSHYSLSADLIIDHVETTALRQESNRLVNSNSWLTHFPGKDILTTAYVARVTDLAYTTCACFIF